METIKSKVFDTKLDKITNNKKKETVCKEKWFAKEKKNCARSEWLKPLFFVCFGKFGAETQYTKYKIQKQK